MKQLKRISGLALKILVSVLISFILLELLLLIFNDLVFRKSFYVYDPDMGFKIRPYVQWGDNITNEFGFNDRDYAHSKNSDVYRILILSDSFNWAGGLDGNYTAILERKFASEFGEQRIEVINAGYSGTHTGEQLDLLKKYGLQYNPDLVVLGFFIGNDFFDADPWRKRIVVGGATTDIDIRQDREMTLFGQLLTPQSRLYLFLKEQWYTYKYLQTQQQIASQPGSEPISPTLITAAPIAYTEKYLAIELGRMQVANWDYASDFQVHIDFIFGELLTMRDLLAEHNIDFIIAAYPDEFQVDQALRHAVIDHYGLSTANYQWDRPQGLLWQFCTEQGIEFYDMLPVFQERHNSGQSLYTLNDSHWNKAGNELAAHYLFDVLSWRVGESLKDK